MAKKFGKKHRVTKENDGFSMVKHALVGSGAAMLCSVILSVVAALIAYGTADPNRFTTPLALCALYLSAIFGGVIAIRLHRTDTLLCGGISGGVLMLLHLLLSCFLPQGFDKPLPLLLLLLLRLLTIVAAILGAYIGFPREKRRRRR